MRREIAGRPSKILLVQVSGLKKKKSPAALASSLPRRRMAAGGGTRHRLRTPIFVFVRSITCAAHARRVLGLGDAGLDASVLKQAWRRSALATHPDRGGTAAQFREVNLAYELLRQHASSAGGCGGAAAGWAHAAPGGAEWDEEAFREWHRRAMEEEEAEERRRWQEEVDSIPRFFTWRLGLRILVGALLFRGLVVAAWIHLPNENHEASPPSRPHHLRSPRSQPSLLAQANAPYTRLMTALEEHPDNRTAVLEGRIKARRSLATAEGRPGAEVGQTRGNGAPG